MSRRIIPGNRLTRFLGIDLLSYDSPEDDAPRRTIRAWWNAWLDRHAPLMPPDLSRLDLADGVGQRTGQRKAQV